MVVSFGRVECLCAGVVVRFYFTCNAPSHPEDTLVGRRASSMFRWGPRRRMPSGPACFPADMRRRLSHFRVGGDAMEHVNCLVSGITRSHQNIIEPSNSKSVVITTRQHRLPQHRRIACHVGQPIAPAFEQLAAPGSGSPGGQASKDLSGTAGSQAASGNGLLPASSSLRDTTWSSGALTDSTQTSRPPA
jgi:hypothetical protein